MLELEIHKPLSVTLTDGFIAASSRNEAIEVYTVQADETMMNDYGYYVVDTEYGSITAIHYTLDKEEVIDYVTNTSHRYVMPRAELIERI